MIMPIIAAEILMACSRQGLVQGASGKDSPEVATVLEAQAASLQARGRGAEAAPLLKRAAEIRAAVK